MIQKTWHKLVYQSGWKTAGSQETPHEAYITGFPSQHPTLTWTLPWEAASPSSLELQHWHRPTPAFHQLVQPLDLLALLVHVTRIEVNGRIPVLQLRIITVSRHLPRQRSIHYVQLQKYSDIFYTYPWVYFQTQHKLSSYSHLQNYLSQLLVLW